LLYPHKITVRVKSLRDGGIVQERKTPMSLQMSYIVTPASQKIPALCQLLERLEPRPSRSIVFFSTCFAVKYFARVLHGVLPPGFSIVSLHGKLEPQVREKNFERFVNATSPTVLLTTDIAARGLDIPQVDLVVQHDPPTDTKVFIHRCGRAGRAGRRGLAVVLLQPGREEGYVQLLDVRQTPITPLTKPPISVTAADAELASSRIRAQARADRDIYQLAQRAFVSWARSYLEHQATSIFRVADLDWADLAHGYGLLELPKMPEVRGLDRSLGLAIDTENIPFRDKDREKKRLAELEQWKKDRAAREALRANGGGAGGGAGDAADALKRKKNDAWSGKHEQEDVKVARREKKRRKREAQRLGDMTEREREEQRKLDEMIAEVRRRNAEAAAAGQAAGGGGGGGGGDEFEGFDD
jgi:ATP-dependent RNA helicase DDX55/SPB4